MSGGRFGMEIISGIERRRRWRPEEKLRIVDEAEAPGAVFALVARRHEVSRGQLWKWRTQVRSGELTAAQPVLEFIPAQVLPGETSSVPHRRTADAAMNAPDPQRARPLAQLAELSARRIGICCRKCQRRITLNKPCRSLLGPPTKAKGRSKHGSLLTENSGPIGSVFSGTQQCPLWAPRCPFLWAIGSSPFRSNDAYVIS